MCALYLLCTFIWQNQEVETRTIQLQIGFSSFSLVLGLAFRAVNYIHMVWQNQEVETRSIQLQIAFSSFSLVLGLAFRAVNYIHMIFKKWYKDLLRMI